MNYKPEKIFMREKLSIEDNGNFYEDFIISGDDKDMIFTNLFPVKAEVYTLFICMEGDVNIIIGSKKYQMMKNDICVIFPGDILQIRKMSRNFNGYVIALVSSFVYNVNIPSSTSIYLYIKENRCISVSDKERDDLIKIYLNMKNCDARHVHPYRKEISDHLIIALLYEIMGLYKKNEPLNKKSYSRKDQLFFEFTELVNINCLQERGVEFYADKLCISSRYLSSVCKDIEGQTAKDCIDEYVINNIGAALNSTNQTIAQIADEFNFPNASFFTKYFKEHTGLTPKLYRDKFRG